MKLSETVEMMNSDDYKERFKAEYQQLKARYSNLHIMLIKMEAHTLDFDPKCDINLLATQAKHMGNYLKCLEIRAEIEGIVLD